MKQRQNYFKLLNANYSIASFINAIVLGILALLIISLSTIGKKHIVDGVGKLIDGVINIVTKNNSNIQGGK